MAETAGSTATSGLATLEERWGARNEALPEGVRVVADYGDVEREYRALRTGCGLVDLSWPDRLVLTGEDRQRFLNGLVTRDVKRLQPGEGCFGFLTDGRGRVLADVAIRALEGKLWVELPPGSGAGVREHLEKYIVADRVEVHAGEGLASVALAGPEAEARLAAATEGGELLREPWAHREAEVLGRAVQLGRHERFGVPAWTIWVEGERAEEVAGGLVDRLGAVPCGYRALDLVRVEAAVPWFGRDFGPENLPQETGLEGVVDYDKGCYLGQEIVARLHYRGQASRLVRRLEFDVAEPPVPGTELLYDDREAGRVTSAVLAPGAPRPVGLGLIQRRACEPGTRLAVEGGGTAQVAVLEAAASR